MSSLRGLRMACGLVLLALLTSSCAVDRSYFQMDSNSGIPFFGFDLIPRKTSAHAPPPTPFDASTIVLRGQDR